MHTFAYIPPYLIIQSWYSVENCSTGEVYEIMKTNDVKKTIM